MNNIRWNWFNPVIRRDKCNTGKKARSFFRCEKTQRIKPRASHCRFAMVWQVEARVHSRVLGQRRHDVSSRGNLGLIPRHTYKPQLSAAGNVTSIPAAPSHLITTLRLTACPHYPLNVFSGRGGCEDDRFQEFNLSRLISRLRKKSVRQMHEELIG